MKLHNTAFLASVLLLLDAITLGAAAVDKNDVCSNFNDCTSCRSIDGCYWHTDLNKCGNTAAGWLFYGDATCQDTTCEGCLELGGAWANGCVNSCKGYDFCKFGNNNNNNNNSDICEWVNESWKKYFGDFDLCSDKDSTDCETCTSTVLSDGTTTCSWHPKHEWCNSSPTSNSINDPKICTNNLPKPEEDEENEE